MLGNVNITVSARRPFEGVIKMADALVKNSKFARQTMYRHSRAKNDY
jgi:hypothetical protein